MAECRLCGKNGEDLTLLSADHKDLGESWSVKSVGRNFGIKIVCARDMIHPQCLYFLVTITLFYTHILVGSVIEGWGC